MRRISFCLVFACVFWTDTGHAQRFGRVHGTVFDESFAVIPGVEITFDSPGFETKTTTDSTGQYQIDLPPGTSAITAHLSGFEIDRRGTFAVEGGSNILLNVRLLVAIMDGPERLEHQLALRSKKHPSIPILVRYTLESKTKGFTEYHGTPRLSYLPVPKTSAVLSFDAVVIYADIIAIENGSLRVRLSGDVILEDGKNQRRASAVTIDLDAPDPAATLRLQPE